MLESSPLAQRLALFHSGNKGELLDLFLDYVKERGLTLYPAQEDAILELTDGKNVVLATPTGSGKSLVATAMAFRTLANGGRAFYTCPIKALVSEKFFDLCNDFGPERVGMMTGDATINADAPIIVCTAEIAASMALRQGVDSPIDGLIMDEFHYYADRDRGAAWQIPLLLLSRSRFLLMSATIGDARPFLRYIEDLTGVEATLVEGTDRPVPLEWNYSEDALHETVRDLVGHGKSPIYVVAFTQRACAEEAQNLMSENFCSKEEKRAIAEALEDVRWDSPYGKEISKFVRHGIGIHHAGLLPKYRLAVEKLAQKGLLKVICGTDTLGVGVNVPIKTVLFTKLCKFDGEKTLLLSAREFHQIAGRAGRKGFDVLGTIVVQAPEHAIENIKIDRKREQDPKKYKKLQRAKPPTRGYVHWDRSTFDRLVAAKPEPLTPRFAISHGMLIDLLGNEAAGKKGGYGELLRLIERSHLDTRQKRAERKRAPELFRSLRNANIIEIERREGRRGSVARVAEHLQLDFSLHHTLSLYMLETLAMLFETKEDEMTYALDVVSLVEAILENPRAILERQLDKAKGDKINELKAAGVEYEERMAELEKVDIVKPNAELIYATFNDFAKRFPWASADNVRPKSIARDMFERYQSFDDYIREYDLARSEGVLLRYLTEALKTLEQSVPERLKVPALFEIEDFLKDEVRFIDDSLLREWERRRDGDEEVPVEGRERAPREVSLSEDPKALFARVRKELHALLKAMSKRDFAGMAALSRPGGMDVAALTEATEKFFAEKRVLLVHHEARKPEYTNVTQVGPERFGVSQTLVDESGEGDWQLEGEVDLSAGDAGPLVQLRRIGP